MNIISKILLTILIFGIGVFLIIKYVPDNPKELIVNNFEECPIKCKEYLKGYGITDNFNTYMDNTTNCLCYHK